MIAVTGANGYLWKLVIEGLLERVPSDQIIAAARSPEKAFSFGTLGMQVREADYTRPETLSLALHGVKKVLLISAAEIDQRFKKHKAVIDAAKDAGVELLVYTSLLRADSSEL
jgi:NAD(P)H dehydrogenase (quinone)